MMWPGGRAAARQWRGARPMSWALPPSPTEHDRARSRPSPRPTTRRRPRREPPAWPRRLAPGPSGRGPRMWRRCRSPRAAHQRRFRGFVLLCVLPSCQLVSRLGNRQTGASPLGPPKQQIYRCGLRFEWKLLRSAAMCIILMRWSHGWGGPRMRAGWRPVVKSARKGGFVKSPLPLAGPRKDPTGRQWETKPEIKLIRVRSEVSEGCLGLYGSSAAGTKNPTRFEPGYHCVDCGEIWFCRNGASIRRSPCHS